MSAAKFMNILAQRDQQYLENPEFNSYQQFKQAIQTLGFQHTQSTQNNLKNQCTPPTADNSPYFFSKQELWQKNQDQLAKQVNPSSSKSYRAIYPNKKLTSLEERYQQHNSQSYFMNKVLSSEPSPLLQYIRNSIDNIIKNRSSKFDNCYQNKQFQFFYSRKQQFLSQTNYIIQISKSFIKRKRLE